MGAGVSIHVIDVTRGLPASGLLVELCALDGGRRRIGGGALGPRGTLEDERLVGALAVPGRVSAPARACRA